jgi:hypothetical protein
VTAKEGNLVFLKKQSKWAEKKLTTEKINHELLIVTYLNGFATWYLAAEEGTPQVIYEISRWAI